MLKECFKTTSLEAFPEIGKLECAKKIRCEETVVLGATWSQHKGSERLAILSAPMCDQHILREARVIASFLCLADSGGGDARKQSI